MTRMIALLVYPGFELMDASGPASVFAGANRELREAGAAESYEVKLVSAKGGLVESSSGVALDTAATRDLPPEKVHTALVTGAEWPYLQSAIAEPAVGGWLRRAASAAERVGSVCSGAFILAAHGLLDGKQVATHWDACAGLAALHPEVRVDPESLYLCEGKLWTSAGVTTGIDMALAMVAEDLDAAIAGRVAKRLVLYARRPGHQSQFSPLLDAQMQAGSPFADLIAWMEANLDAPLDVPLLADRAGLSERSFYRKFLAATGQSPARFVEILRLDAARLLLSEGMPLKTIAVRVGLSPARRLAEAFERRFGITPKLFRELHGGL